MKFVQEFAVFVLCMIAVWAACARKWDKATFFLVWAAIIEYGGKW